MKSSDSNLQQINCVRLLNKAEFVSNGIWVLKVEVLKKKNLKLGSRVTHTIRQLDINLYTVNMSLIVE